MRTLAQALEHYKARTGNTLLCPRAVLYDMDGVLYDSMPLHARAWKKMCDDNGIPADPDEFFAYEGMTGATTIRLLVERAHHRTPTDEECRQLYAQKSACFAAFPAPPQIPGAHACLDATVAAGAVAVLVTGSGQASLLDRLERDFPGIFPRHRCITAHDVTHGKPHPEPYVRGMQLAEAKPCETIAIDNAPLGVQSAAASGAFTIGVRTGPLPAGSLLRAGADIEVDSMDAVDKILRQLL